MLLALLLAVLVSGKTQTQWTGNLAYSYVFNVTIPANTINSSAPPSLNSLIDYPNHTTNIQSSTSTTLLSFSNPDGTTQGFVGLYANINSGQLFLSFCPNATRTSGTASSGVPNRTLYNLFYTKAHLQNGSNVLKIVIQYDLIYIFCNSGSVATDIIENNGAGEGVMWYNSQSLFSVVNLKTYQTANNNNAPYSTTTFLSNGASTSQYIADGATTFADPKFDFFDYDSPTITPSGSTTLCSGSSVTLTSSLGTSYLWSDGEATQSITVNPTSTTTYSVSVTDAQSVSLTSSPITITVNPLPSAKIEHTDNWTTHYFRAKNESTKDYFGFVNCNSGYSFQWYYNYQPTSYWYSFFTGQTGTDCSFSFLKSGGYSPSSMGLWVKDNSTGCTNNYNIRPSSGNGHFHLQNTPTISDYSSSSDAVNQGGAVTLTTSNQDATYGYPLEYLWSTDAAGLNIVGDSSTITIYPDTTATYYVTLIDSNGNYSTSSGLPITVNKWISQPRNTGNGLNFNGTSNYVYMPSTGSSFNFGTGDFSIEAYVNTTTQVSTISNIVAHYDSTNYNNFYALTIGPDGTVMFGFSNAGVNGSTSIIDGKWHHIVGVRSSGQLYLYIDGKSDATPVSSTATSISSNGGISIGNIVISNVPTYFFTGSLDEVRVWNTALSQTQIRARMNQELTLPQTGLIVYYNFNQGVAGSTNTGLTTLIDNSGNGVSGTLYNFSLSGVTSNWVAGTSFNNTPFTTNYLNFNGNNYVAMPKSSTLGLLNNSFTVEALVNVSNFSSGDQAILADPTNCDLHLIIRNQHPYLGFCGNDLQGNTTMSPGVWYHIAYEYNASTGTQSIYVNGVLDNSSTGHGALTQDAVLAIGKCPWGTLTGSVDELRVWNVVRTPSQIQNAMNSELSAMDTAGLVAYYSFDQGSAGNNNAAITSLVDKSIYKNNGTLMNFALSGATSNWITDVAGTASATICASNTYQLSDTSNGGTWSSSNPSVATVSSTGLVKGIVIGTATINYTVANANGYPSDIASTTINVINNSLDREGLTNSTTAAAAYGLRLLSSTYTGKAISVRNSSNNAVQDIGFTVNGDLDTVSLKNFIGSNSGFINIWYDQSGNGNNAIQINTSAQPRIVNVGAIDRVYGWPTITFQNNSQYLLNSSTTSVQTVNAVRNLISSSYQTLFAAPANTDFSVRCNGSFNGTSNVNYTDGPNGNDWVVNTGSPQTIWVNGTQTLTGSSALHTITASSVAVVSNTSFSISSTAYSRGMTGGDALSELTLFPSTLSTSARQSLEGTEAAYYINGNVLDKAGLSTSTGGLAAYSLRLLSSTYFGKAINVLRSSDNTKIDIGFTNSGSLDTASLLSFVGTGNGYVTTWYDQSGKGNNVIQTNTSNQPTIVKSGVINRSNGLPSILFNGSNTYLRAVLPSLSSTTPHTLNAVAKATSGNMVSLSSTSSSNQNSSLGVGAQSNTGAWYGGFGEDGSYAVSIANYSSLAVRSKTYSPTTISGYFNGVSKFTNTSTTYNLSTPDIMVGVQNNANNQWLNGLESEITVFTTAISNTDRQALETNQINYYNNCSALVATPNVDNGLNFNGSNNNVSIKTSNSVSGSFTVEAWVNPASTGGVCNIFSTRTSGNYFDFKLQGGIIHGDIGNTGNSWITTNADASFSYSANTWYHIAYVVTPSGYTIYANGNQVGSGSYSNGTPLLYNSNNYISIGAVSTGNGENFNGNIDEVSVWNIALSQAQIQATMNTEPNGYPAGLVDYYNFNEGIANGNNSGISGSYLFDWGPAVNVGTFNNFSFNGTSSNFVPGAPSVAASSYYTGFSAGGYYQLNNYTTGGTWASSNTSVAVVNSSGLVTAATGTGGGSANISYTYTNASGCTEVASTPMLVSVIRALALKTSKPSQLSNHPSLQEDNQTSISIYPNPARNEVTLQLIEGMEEAKIDIVSTLGLSIMKDNSGGLKRTLNLGSEARGIYIVKIIQKDGSITTKKLILE